MNIEADEYNSTTQTSVSDIRCHPQSSPDLFEESPSLLESFIPDNLRHDEMNIDSENFQSISFTDKHPSLKRTDSKGSSYIPTQTSSVPSSDFESKLPLFTYIPYNFHLFTEGQASQQEFVSNRESGFGIIVPEAALLKLLSKCQRHNCPESVLPNNMEFHYNGK